LPRPLGPVLQGFLSNLSDAIPVHPPVFIIGALQLAGSPQVREASGKFSLPSLPVGLPHRTTLFERYPQTTAVSLGSSPQDPTLPLPQGGLLTRGVLSWKERLYSKYRTECAHRSFSPPMRRSQIHQFISIAQALTLPSGGRCLLCIVTSPNYPTIPTLPNS
jgi:hypothetical protein